MSVHKSGKAIWLVDLNVCEFQVPILFKCNLDFATVANTDPYFYSNKFIQYPDGSTHLHDANGGMQTVDIEAVDKEERLIVTEEIRRNERGNSHEENMTTKLCLSRSDDYPILNRDSKFSHVSFHTYGMKKI